MSVSTKTGIELSVECMSSGGRKVTAHVVGLAPTYFPVPLPSAYGSHVPEHFMGQLGCWSSSHHIRFSGHQQKEVGERGRTVSLLPLGTHSYHGTQERVFAQLALCSGRKWSSATLRSLMNML